MHACQRWSCAPSSCLQVPLISSWKILTKRVLFLLCVVMAAEGNCGHPLACRPLGERILLICSSRFFRQWLWPDGAAHHAWPSDTRSLPGKCSADGCLLFRSVFVCVSESEKVMRKSCPQYSTKPKWSGLFPAQMFLGCFDVGVLIWCEQVACMCWLMSHNNLLPPPPSQSRLLLTNSNGGTF